MKKKRRQRVMSILMALLMIVGLVPTDFSLTTAKAATTTIDVSGGLTAGTVYGDADVCKVEVLENMPAKAVSPAATVEGTSYTAYVQGATNPSPKAGDVPTLGAAFKITAVTDCSITFVTKAAAKVYHFVESTKTDSDITGASVPDGSMNFNVKAGKTYYFYLDGSKVCVYGISISSGSTGVDWTKVAAPVLGTPVQSGSKIDVPYTAEIGDAGAEQISVEMYNGTTLVDTQISKAAGSTGTVSFSPAASGTYTFKAKLSRTGQTDIASAAPDASGTFVLPLSAPVISSATSLGNKDVDVVWNAVTEATGYQVSYSADGTTYSTPVAVTALNYTVTGLTVGTTYTFKVEATRGTDVSAAGTMSALVTQTAQTVWTYSGFGQGVDTANNGYSGSVAGNDLRVFSLAGKGKLVPASTDGLAYYYTAIDSSKNFTLSAKVKVNSWTFSNGQEGFGLMACDRVGVNGNSSVFWNNSIMLSATKVEYFYDAATSAITDDSTKPKISMKLGVGAQEKKGVTLTNLAKLEANDTATVTGEFSTKMNTLETSCAGLGAASYNIIGNATNASVITGNQENLYTELNMTIKRDNTGYRCIFTDMSGNVVQKTYYDIDGTNLTQLDPANIYVGFFASRNADISLSDVSLTTIDRSADAPAEQQEMTYITPNFKVTSATATGIENYNLTFAANAAGNLTVTDPNGNVIVDNQAVAANDTFTAPAVTLTKSSNKFNVVFTPAPDANTNDFEALSSYDAVQIEHTVAFKKIGTANQSLYVSPTGSSSGTGNPKSPLDLPTAFKYVQPGQTIVLMEGTYVYETALKVERGINGTANQMIYMVADPNATTRPVIDFNKVGAGITFAGDYWYLKGFDITNSLNGQKGLQLSGSHCTLDQINAYNNGNTGIQISRYLTTDQYAQWPAYNLVLNCTSHNNADAGYEDADGFAAKLTIGDGNVFRGCIAHNNADDGWDLFAKVESGKIGSVLIENCVAYANGILEDGTNAGNGNGFKLGGSSMSGYHQLKNSVAYANKAKGIDSNSCPDIQVSQCTTFNNGSSNIALYTNDAASTDFAATGVLSFRTTKLDVKENFKFKSTQDHTKVFNTTNYFWTYTTATSTGKSINTLTSFDDWYAIKATEAGSSVTFTPAMATNPTEANSNWFVSLDTNIVPTRYADGSINMNGLLVLTDNAPAGVGARIIATPSASIVIPPATGDSGHFYFFFTLTLFSGAALVGLYFYDKKRRVYAA